MDDSKYEAIKRIRQWQREHRRLEEQIDALSFTVDVRKREADIQRHLFALSLVQQIFEKHCRTEVEILQILPELDGAGHLELAACQRQMEKDHVLLRKNIAEILYYWERKNRMLEAKGNHLFHLFAENWQQHEERIELAIGSFFPAYPTHRRVGALA